MINREDMLELTRRMTPARNMAWLTSRVDSFGAFGPALPLVAATPLVRVVFVAVSAGSSPSTMAALRRR